MANNQFTDIEQNFWDQVFFSCLNRHGDASTAAATACLSTHYRRTAPEAIRRIYTNASNEERDLDADKG